MAAIMGSSGIKLSPSCCEFLPVAAIDAVRAGAGIKTRVGRAEVVGAADHQAGQHEKPQRRDDRPGNHTVHCSILLYLVGVRLADKAPECFYVAGMRPAFDLWRGVSRPADGASKDAHLRDYGGGVLPNGFARVVQGVSLPSATKKRNV